MKINNLRKEKNGDRQRVAATVTWENCNRSAYDVYFETEEEFSADLTLNPNAFLLACAIPAMHYGEERVFIDAEICPELRDGINTALMWLKQWFYERDHALINIEAKPRIYMPSPQTADRAGVFFTGGVDSLATLLVNRNNFPIEHPWSMKDGFIVYGFDIDEIEAFELVRKSLLDVADNLGLTLIPVYTNTYLPYRQEDSVNKYSFWYHEFMGAALSAVAHAFSNRLTMTTIATDYDIPNQQPHGTHPLIDPCYSSSDLRIRHDGITLSRFEKTRLIAKSDVALQNLRVCNKYKLFRSNMLNCSKCEKCVRTMLALVALDVLTKTNAFQYHDVTEELVSSMENLKPSTLPFYKELSALLAERGRIDLVRPIEHKIKSYHMLKRKEIFRKFTVEPLKYIDRKFLNSNLRKLKRAFF